MKIVEIYNQMETRGLTASQRHFSAAWLERGENYLSQNKEAEMSAADAVTLWRNLRSESEYELAAKLLTVLLEGL